jgi:S1-C subfamily serine protease
MKRIALLICLISFISSFSSKAQIVTDFYGTNTVQSDGYTGALYRVEIYNNATYVTVELKPTKKKSRINYYSSRNTIIDCGSGFELPIAGFLRNGQVDTAPFSGNWGWDNPEVGKSYRYTMVFVGRIPGGVTKFTLKDKGDYSGAHGFGFSNYTIKNPDPCEHTGLTEYSIKSKSDENNDGIVGIYEGYNNNKYKLGVIKSGASYKLVYLGGGKSYPWWHIGDVKAVLKETATPGLYKADWYMLDKSVESNSFVGFDGGSMRVIIEGQDEDGYIKMYPTASAVRTQQGQPLEWSGTGFALKNGYIVTNFHVVDGAKRIEVHGVNGNASSDYAADVVATDKNNDLAIIRISDYRFSGFGTIPYAIKSPTVDVGEDVWVLGYPLTQFLGNEIKLTNGVISARSGYQGDVSTYQISAPVQPGNSGGPLFDSKGNIVGIVNAGVPGAENVGYAIKTSYLVNLADSYSLSTYLPTSNSISSLTLKEQVKRVNNYVFLLLCSSKPGQTTSSYRPSSPSSGSTSPTTSSSSSTTSKPSTPSSGTVKENPVLDLTFDSKGMSAISIDKTAHVFNNPEVRKTYSDKAVINRIIITKQNTILEMTCTYGAGGWCSIEKTAALYANGTQYTLIKAENIPYSPDTYKFTETKQKLSFRLYFPAIDITDVTELNFVESNSSNWRFYGISLKQ